MTKSIDCRRSFLAVLLAVGLSAGCPADPVAGTTALDAGPPDTSGGPADGPTVELDAGPACGNGWLEPGEECDDRNTNDLDGCSARCTLEPGKVCPEPGQPCTPTPFCGDGQLSAGEQCDLGVNDGRYGGCNADCTLGPYCGDGLLQPGHEDCDDGVNDGHYRGCNPDCKRAPYCGDGILGRDTEECDDGNDQNGDGCSSTCRCENSACGQPASVCGDGKLDVALGEECDDLNVINDDGCSDTCRLEPCWNTCGCNSTMPCTTVVYCGDGKVEGGESCDDGNTSSADGCSGICQIERGWTCVVPGGPCSPVCGDGIVVVGEECDDRNTQDQDGCSSTCQLEPNY